MIQDISPSVMNNQFDKAAVPDNEDTVLIFSEGRILAKCDGEVIFPKVSDLIVFNKKKLLYLFGIDETRFFLHIGKNCDSAVDPELGFVFWNLKDLREAKMPPKSNIYAAYTGKHLSDWYRDNKYCGRCGTKMVHSENERAKVCPECNYTAYPRIMPAVIVGVINGDRILITRYKRGYNHNALIAGFTEIGETLEETVAREVMEEAGVKVANIRYYKSQPWGIANDILVGFFCDVQGDATIKMDDNELKFAEWLLPEEIELQPDDSSLTNEMMKLFKDGKITSEQ